jgi:Type IIB DNA topoisomerase
MPPKRKRPAASKTAESEDDVSIEEVPAKAKPRGKGRKVVVLAKDADKVLKKCRELKATLRAKATASKEASPSDDSDDLSSLEGILPPPKTTTTTSTVAKKLPPNIVEVSELNANEVLEGMEAIALGIANQVLSRQGFSMVVPSRASSNQIYAPDVDRIVLGDKSSVRNFLHVKDSRKSAITLRVMQLLHTVLTKRIHITKRDLFYTDVKLFVNQMDSDGVLDDLATMVGCTRSNLHVVASDKGLVVGRVQFEEDGDYIDCTKMGVGGKVIWYYRHPISSYATPQLFSYSDIQYHRQSNSALY